MFIDKAFVFLYFWFIALFAVTIANLIWWLQAIYLSHDIASIRRSAMLRQLREDITKLDKERNGSIETKDKDTIDHHKMDWQSGSSSKLSNEVSSVMYDRSMRVKIVNLQLI